MHLISTAVESGVVSCNFEVDAVRTLVDTTSPTGANLTFDLNQPYYLLLAIGELSAGTVSISYAFCALMIDVWGRFTSRKQQSQT